MKRTLNSFCMGNLLALVLFLFPNPCLFAFEGVEFRLRPHQIPKDYGPRDVQAEIEFGRNLGGIILKRHSLYPDRELQKYVNLVGNGIAELMGRPELQYHFGVIDTELVNAYATPGGYVFVSFGALKLMENEAQLVGVIAHEIAHIDLRHEVKKLKIRALEDSYSTEISAIFGSTSATKRVLFEQMTGKAMKILFEEGRSKEMEVEADLQGIRTMMELGYDWKSYINYLEKLDHLMGDASAEISKTHPTSHERIAAIEKLVADQKFVSKPGKKNQKRFEAYVRL